MNLTRCPVCATVFRVLPDQLKAHGGKVRCGNCGKVFDGRAAMLDSSSSTTTAPTPARAGAAARRETAPTPASSVAEGAATDFDFEPEFNDGDLSVPGSRAEPEPVIVDAQFDANADEYASPYFQFEHEELASGPLEATARSERGEELVSSDEDDALAEAKKETEPPRKRYAVWLWGLAALLMLLALGAQAAYVFRSDLGLHYPELRPRMVEFCAALGCEVPLPHKVDQVGIEASDLHPDPQRKSSLVLAATLKNRAPFAQAYPHLELTLTDARDQAIARRVIEPKEYLSTGTNITTGFAANQELAVHVLFEVSGLDPTGYRVYIFYP